MGDSADDKDMESLNSSSEKKAKKSKKAKKESKKKKKSKKGKKSKKKKSKHKRRSSSSSSSSNEESGDEWVEKELLPRIGNSNPKTEDSDNEDDIIGPQLPNKVTLTHKEMGGALLPGEGAAMAAYVK